MKKIYLVFIISLITSNIFSQEVKSDLNQYNWKTFDFSENESVERFISENKAEFGLSDKDEMYLKSQEIDELAIEHYRFEHFFNGVKVEGSDYIIHRSSDKAWGNGRLVYGVEADQNSSLSEEEALLKALEYIGSEKFYWEDKSQEEFIKWFEDDPDATFYPSGELVFADEQFRQDGNNYQLFWKFDIYAHGEKMREYVYVNASDGSIGHSRDAICYSSVEGTAHTNYYGEQTIITDSISSDSYRLVDETRGGGVYTFDLELTPASYVAFFDPSIHFYDDDNIWDSENDDSDPVAIDAHWGTEKTYDFYLEKYNRNSFDDEGAKMVIGVHMGINSTTCIGAGFFSGMYVGMGDGPNCINPGYYLEHVGHEFTHGVTAHSSVLECGIEASALNESFSNILGTAIEFYANPDNATWVFNATLPYDMSDPNWGNFPRCDTYLGNYWDDPPDNRYVKGAVQDYWYYLLSEGGTGVNDNSDSYSVEGIGMEKATDIVYRNLTLYMIPAATFTDARHGSIQAAIDLYGECSNEVAQVINAWYAVGVGPTTASHKDISLVELISPRNNCGLSEEEIVEVEMNYNFSGCTDLISSGSEIEMNYQLNDEDIVSETLVLSEDLLEGESINYTFVEMINIPDTGEVYTLSVWINYSEDEIQFNDSIVEFKTGLKYQVLDEEYSMTFTDLTNSIDSFYVNAGCNADVFISEDAANTGEYGFSMSSSKSNPATISNDESLNFNYQKGSISEICFCVNAEDWETVTLYFDMKQTHSMLYNNFYGSDSTEYVSSMRMMVNGEQFEEQFHPDSYVDDPYLTYSYSLDQFDLAGSNFEFCFQSKNGVNDLGDNSPFFPYDSDGDNTYIDNIRFVNTAIVGVEEIEAIELSIYPNPTNDLLFIESDNGVIALDIRMFNQLGQMVLHVENSASPLDVSFLEPGVYFIEINAENGIKREKIIIQ